MAKYKEQRNGPNYMKQRTALDDLASLEMMKKATKVTKGNTDSEFEFSDVDTNVSKHVVDYSSDSSRQGTHFTQRTSIIDIDFPASAKVSKLDAKHPKNLQRLNYVGKKKQQVLIVSQIPMHLPVNLIQVFSHLDLGKIISTMTVLRQW